MVPVWEMIVFLLNGLIFILIGLQLAQVLQSLSGRSLLRLCGQAAVLNLVLIVARGAWIFAVTYLPLILRRKPATSPRPNWGHIAIVAWTGMRGVVSLAAAMALPLRIGSGLPFPGRDLILFHTFAVILVTLVLQGLSLPFIIRWLGVIDDGTEEKEEQQARIKAVRAALERLDDFKGKGDDQLLGSLRLEFERRFRELESAKRVLDNSLNKPQSTTYEVLLAEALEAERRMILQLRNEGSINDDVLRRIQRDLDLVELRFNRS